MELTGWTAISNPGREPVGRVWRNGRVSPRGAGWSLDAWVLPEGGAVQAAQTQPAGAVRQRLQDRLPVVATAFEAGSLRLLTEAWCFESDGRELLAVQAVVFNLSDDPARGHFCFALRPQISAISYADNSFVIDGKPALRLLAAPDAGWDCRVGDDIPRLEAPLANNSSASDEAGRCLGLACYRYDIAPWEEAEFTAFPLPDATEPVPLPQMSYGLLKGAATRRWQAALAGGMRLSAPDLRLSESWDANRAHLLVLDKERPSGADVPIVREMQQAQELVYERSPEAWPRIRRLLNSAAPTFAWPDAAGNHSREASAAWLDLLHDMMVFGQGERLVIGAGLASEWLALPGELVVLAAPTQFGSLDFTIRWQDGGELELELTAEGEPSDGYEWALPWPAEVGEVLAENGSVVLPPGARRARARRVV